MNSPGDSALKKTPLFEVHRSMGARMAPFAGWNMPIQYTGILEEHRAVRRSAGLFDLSHMGELVISGPDALTNVQYLTTNDASTLEPGMAQYTFLTNAAGGVIDDLIVYCVSPTEYLLIVNAANTEKDREWILQNLKGAATLQDRTHDTALIAIQGPQAVNILQRVTETDLQSIPTFGFARGHVADCDTMLSRTGYTGEDGFECLVGAGRAKHLWDTLLTVGEEHGLVPVGLGARDTLRLEARLCLYGHELTEETTPIEAGLGFFVKPEKGEFIGRDTLARQKAEGVERRLVGFAMEQRGIPRQGYAILDADGRRIGTVTSGSFAPSVEREIGMGYVATEYAAVDTEIFIEVRTRRLKARVVKGRFLALRGESK